MHYSNGTLVEILLIIVLILDRFPVDEVPEVGASIPANVIGVDVNFAELLDHFCLVRGVLFLSWSSGGWIGAIVVAIRRWNFDVWKWEGIGDLKSGFDVHAD